MSTQTPSRGLVLAYGSVAYVSFLAVFLYAIAFVGDIRSVGGFTIPKTIDSGAAGPVGEAIKVNVILLAIFALQHSIMARPGFKTWWKKYVPEPVERSTYVLLSNVLMILLFWLWRPMPELVWELHGLLATAAWALFALGWGIILVTSFLIDHFDLFGLRQVILYFRGREYTRPVFQERSLYRLVRHPLMLGWLMAFWFIPVMTQGHLLFSVVTSLYILVAIRIEEGDLSREHGEVYASYRRRVSMIIPLPRKRG